MLNMKRDYVCGIPVFKFNRAVLGDEVDVFISGGYHGVDNDEGLSPIKMYESSSFDTIMEYYDAIEELSDLKKKAKSWAV